MNRGETHLITAGPLKIEIGRDGDAHRVELRGELDAGGVETLTEELKRIDANGSSGDLVLDLSGLEFIDSAGIVLLVEAHRRSQGAGSNLRIVRPNGHVAKLMRLAGLDDVLPFAD